MKNFLFILLAAILGGLAALGGAKYLGLDEKVRYVEVEQAPRTNLTKFAETAPERDLNVTAAPSEGFSVAARKALPAVVHIKASKPAGRGGRGGRQIDPNMIPESLRDLFGPGMRGGPDGGEAPLQQGSGSGVIISADGYIATNNHVVEDAENLEVVLNDQQTYSAKIIGTDPTTDIALIKIDATALPTVKFGDSDATQVGEWVVAVGNPFSLTSTVTAGIVSAKGRSIDIVRRSGGDMAIESFIQTDAVVNPGNSGGALVNINGDLIGINTAISSPTGVFAGYSFAVPSAIVKKVVEDLREYGVVQRGLLGARIQELNTRFAEELGIDRDNGVYVSEVTPNSAALEAGLRKGDVIIAVDGVTTLRNSELLEQLGRRRPGDKVTLTYVRDGDEETAVATLKNLEGDAAPLMAPEQPVAIEVNAIGAEFVDLGEQERSELGLRYGARLADLDEGLLTETTRVQPGFILTEVNGQAVRSASSAAKLLEQADGTVSLQGIYPDAPDKTIRYAFVK